MHAAPAATSDAPAATPDAPAATPVSKGARIQNFNEVKEANPPDMVCFGYGPKWSIQFTNGAARYLGVNQPDQDFLGAFYWDSDMKVWNWHREDDLAPMNGSFALSGTISKDCLPRPDPRRDVSVFGASQFAAGRHGERLLPQAEAG